MMKGRVRVLAREENHWEDKSCSSNAHVHVHVIRKPDA